MSIEAIKPLAGKDIATLTHAELVTEIPRLLNENTALRAEIALSKPLYSRRQIEARVKLLEEALRPFTKMAGTLPATYGPDHEPIPDDEPVHVSCCGFDLGDITVADLNRALASTGGEHHADK